MKVIKKVHLYKNGKNSFSDAFDKYAQEHNHNKEVVQQIAKHYSIKKAQINDQIDNVVDELSSILSTKNLTTREIHIKEIGGLQFDDPLIVFTKENKTPIVIYPNDRFRPYFISPVTGDYYIVTSDMMEELDDKAISFYHPLPKNKLTAKGYLKYARKFIKPFDGISIVLMIALVTAIGMINPYLLKRLTGEVVKSGDMNLFYVIAIEMTAIYISFLLIKAVQQIVNARISIKSERNIHAALMMRVLSLPGSFFKKYNTGELNARISSVSTLYSLIMDGIVLTGLSSIMSLIYLVQIRDFAPTLILPTLGIVSLNILFIIVISIVERRLMRKQMLASSKERGVSYGLINGIQKIRLTGSEKEAYQKWEDAYKVYQKVKFNPPFIIKIAPAISIIIALAGNVLLYYLVAKNNIDTSSYVAFLASYGSLSGALLLLTSIVGNATKIRPLQEMIVPIIEEEPENAGNKKNVDHLNGNIKIYHLSFKYEENLPLVLNDISIDIKEGDYIAIVGETGCGKSTLVRLLLGLEKPTEGTIYYDENDIKDLNLSSLRKKIGSVTQNGALFHADILSNIIITAPNLGEKEAWEAAKIASIDKDIEEMPMKMRTIISEGQGGISGGQKQRILIARAVVNKPKILIFDEATSSLDNMAQSLISEAIDKLNCTRIVIAHRLSTIKKCQRILYIEGGKILEDGTYQELIDKNGKFKDLVEKQRINS